MPASVQFVTDSNGNVWQLSVDPSGNLSTTKMPSGFAPGTTPAVLADPSGNPWSIAANEDGSLVTEDYTSSRVTDGAPVPSDDSSQYATDTSGTVWKVSTDVAGNMFSVAMPSGFVPSATSQIIVDSAGQAWQLQPKGDGTLETSNAQQVPISYPSSYSPCTTQVGDVLTSVKADITGGVTNPAILLDYVDRIQKRMLRESQWLFMRSGTKRFVTQTGAGDYWLGSGPAPAGAVNTNLNLSDVFSVWTESVYDRSNNHQLFPVLKTSQGTQILPDGGVRPGRPQMFQTGIEDPYILSLFPLPDSGNGYQPVPATPICNVQPGGLSQSRTYYVAVTIVDDAGNESVPSALPRITFVPAGFRLVVTLPAAPPASGSGVGYSRCHVYVGSSPSTMTRQTVSPLSNQLYLEPLTGITSGVSAPTRNALTPIYGYVIEFAYFKTRPTVKALTDVLAVPDVYRDIVVAGVNYLVNLYLSRQEDRDKVAFWKGEFADGLKQMRRDLNLSFRNTNFIAPDPAYRQTRSGYPWL